ncbi:MAG: Crp/Fnr family transcriptional regulator [bacterium]|nr:Crp/Fnr family transcriptional regulator [bacterium]
MIQSTSGKLQKFFAKGKALHYKKGETILRSGDSPQGVYFLDKGYIRLYSISESGEELTLIIFKSNDFFPMMWAINGTENENYLEAITDADLHRCSKEDFRRFIAENSDVSLELTSLTLTRMGGLLQRMEYLAFGSASQKVASIFIICAERFGKKTDNSAIIDIPLTHKDVAMLVGMTRETVSIEIKKFERRGIIDHRGHAIFIKDLRKLQKESLLNN